MVALLQRVAGQPDAQHRSQPVDEALRVGCIHLVPVHQDERERPRRQNPADGAAHPHDAELLLRILHVGEGDGVRDRDGRHIEQAVDQHQAGRTARNSCVKRQSEHRQPADQMAERQELLGRKIAVRELVAEEHPDDGRDGERIQNPAIAGRA